MIRRTFTTGILSVAAIALTANLALAQNRTSKPFTGAKVNAGTVTYAMKDGKTVLTLSDDFKVPDTPDPHYPRSLSRRSCQRDTPARDWCCGIHPNARETSHQAASHPLARS